MFKLIIDKGWQFANMPIKLGEIVFHYADLVWFVIIGTVISTVIRMQYTSTSFNSQEYKQSKMDKPSPIKKDIKRGHARGDYSSGSFRSAEK